MGLFVPLGLDLLFPFPFGEIFNYNLFKKFLIPFLFLFFFWGTYNLNVGALDMVPEVFKTVLSCFHSFYFILIFRINFTILSSSSLIHSSASDSLLLIPSGVFLISIIVLFVSVCLFFHSSTSLLIDSCIFSILFSRILIIFTVIILNSFSGSLPISSSFILTSVFLICSFLHAVFSFFSFHFLKLLCLRSPFPRLQGKLNSFLEEGWILSSFSFLPS